LLIQINIATEQSTWVTSDAQNNSVTPYCTLKNESGQEPDSEA
jgi:hypothetical protein